MLLLGIIFTEGERNQFSLISLEPTDKQSRRIDVARGKKSLRKNRNIPLAQFHRRQIRERAKYLFDPRNRSTTERKSKVQIFPQRFSFTSLKRAIKKLFFFFFFLFSSLEMRDVTHLLTCSQLTATRGLKRKRERETRSKTIGPM